jgi:hypothetical protein
LPCPERSRPLAWGRSCFIPAIPLIAIHAANHSPPSADEHHDPVLAPAVLGYDLAMSAKLCPKIILEGTRLTHKTDLAFALNEHPRIVGPRKYRYHSPLVSAEWCAFTDVPWGRGLINFAPEEEAMAMETYRTWVRLFELQRYYSWIVDRFHLSTRVFQLASRGVAYDFGWLEERLVTLGFHVVLCTRPAATFEAARAERLPVSGKPSQYDDLGAFVREQELFLRLARESKLPRLELDVSDGNTARACERIADWMQSTGGLWAR